jgi:hypothetical protein
VLIQLLGVGGLEIMTLSERVFLMNGVGVGGCVLFGFEVFESG